MSNTLPALVLRTVKGSPLTPQEGDTNLTTIRDFVNALAALLGISLNADGTLVNGALSTLAQISAGSFQLFADSFSSSASLPTGVYAAGNYAVPNAAILAYTAGMRVQFKADTQNAGSATVNVQSLGVKNIYKGVGTALVGGEILANSIVTIIYDGTNFQLVQMTPLRASAADVIAATDVLKAVTPAVLGAAPGMAKAWAKFHWSGAAIVISASFNVASIDHNATGDYTIHFTTPFSSGNYVVSIAAKATNSTPGNSNVLTAIHSGDGGAAGSKRISIFDTTNTAADEAEIHFMAFGTQ